MKLGFFLFFVLLISQAWNMLLQLMQKRAAMIIFCLKIYCDFQPFPVFSHYLNIRVGVSTLCSQKSFQRTRDFTFPLLNFCAALHIGRHSANISKIQNRTQYNQTELVFWTEISLQMQITRRETAFLPRAQNYFYVSAALFWQTVS